MTKKVLSSGVALVLGGSALPLLIPSTATAAPTPQIQKIKSAKAYDGGRTKIKPRFKESPNYDVTSATLSVKQGRKTIAKNKKMVRLRAGTYKVTQTLEFRKFTWLEKRSTIGPRNVDLYDYSKWDDDLGDFTNTSYCTVTSRQEVQGEYEWDQIYRYRVSCYIPSLSHSRLSGGFELDYDPLYVGERIDDYQTIRLDKQTAMKRTKKYGKSYTKRKTQKLRIRRANHWCTSNSEIKRLKLHMTKSQVRRIIGDNGERYSGRGANETRRYDRCGEAYISLLPDYDYVYVKYRNGRAVSIKYYTIRSGPDQRASVKRIIQQ